MGNTTSEVASGVKAQINSSGQGPELYRFVDFKVNLIFEKNIFPREYLGRWRTYRCYAYS
jgi:hypothetical protein